MVIEISQRKQWHYKTYPICATSQVGFCLFILMYLKIKTIDSVTDKYGNNIVITKIGLYNEKDKWIKWVKLNDFTKQLLLNTKIDVSHLNLPNE